MKRILLIACAFIGLNAYARQDVTIKANVQELFLGNFAAEATYALDKNWSVGAFGNYNPGNNYGTAPSVHFGMAANKVLPFGNAISQEEVSQLVLLLTTT